MHSGATGQHPGHIRGDSLLEDADRHQHVHREPGDRRRVLPDRHPVPAGDHDQAVLELRRDDVSHLPGADQHQPVHQQHLPLRDERRPIHRRLPSDFVAQMAHSDDIQDRVRDGVDVQRDPHDTDPQKRAPSAQAGNERQKQLRNRLAGEQYVNQRHRQRRGQRLSLDLHHVHVRLQLRRAVVSDPHLLLPGHPEAEDRRTAEQVQGEEAIAPEGHASGTDCCYGVRALLAPLLGVADHVHREHAAGIQVLHVAAFARLVPELLEFGDEPNLVRVLERQLQEELLEGVHVRGWPRRQRHPPHGEQRVSEEKQAELVQVQAHAGHVDLSEQRGGGRSWASGQQRRRVHVRHHHDLEVQHYANDGPA